MSKSLLALFPKFWTMTTLLFMNNTTTSVSPDHLGGLPRLSPFPAASLLTGKLRASKECQGEGTLHAEAQCQGKAGSRSLLENALTVANHVVLIFWNVFSDFPPLSGLLSATSTIGLSFLKRHYRLFFNMKESTFSMECFCFEFFSLTVIIVVIKYITTSFDFKAVTLS